MAETFAFTNFYDYYIESCLNIWPHAKLIISELSLWVNKTMNMYRNMSRYNFNNGNYHMGRNGMGFYKEIEETYGYEEASLLKKWS